jgi:hypothetical protein
VRPSENWRRHLLLVRSWGSDFIGNLKRRKDLPAYNGGQAQRHGERRDAIREGILLRDAAKVFSRSGRGILQGGCYRKRYVPVNIILRVTENAGFIGDAVAEFPNLGRLGEVQATGEPVVITKRGAPIVQVAPIASGKGDVFGFMAGEFTIVGDIQSPVVPLK